MKHTMRTPCRNCPFRSDQPGYLTGYLSPERIREISESLFMGASFPCHETVDHDAEGDLDEHFDPTQSGLVQCAGAEIFLAHHGTSTQLSRIASRLGDKVSQLDMEAPVFKDLRSMIKGHGGESEETHGETCDVVDTDCLAPAGYMINGAVVEGTKSAGYHCQSCGCSVCANCSRTAGSCERICLDCDEQESE